MGLLLVAMLMGAGADVPRELRPGVVHGTVVDVGDQLPIPDVVVTARSPSLQREQVVVTDAAGRSRFPELPTGVYMLSFEKEAFEPYSRPEVRLRGGRRTRVDVQLIGEHGSSFEYVFETMCGSGIDVGSRSTGISVGEDFIRRIPVHGP